jgi:hypothetical protein
MPRVLLPLGVALVGCFVLWAADVAQPSDARKPKDDAELKYWLQNMVWHHRFRTDEIIEATGLTRDEIADALKKFDIHADNRPKHPLDAPLLVLPYPGGRHPRIGFLDGAVRPQRETKVSVFTPWDQNSYVVADVPEAIWCQHGLLYLAHTHVATIWTKQGINLDPLEWERKADGTLEITRKLPNGVSFGAKVMPGKVGVRMELWLTNGSQEKLTDLRVQNCLMLKGAAGFTKQTRDNKVLSAPYAAARSDDGKHWVIWAWEPHHRAWDNPPCPCIHSDPKFTDCAPGETNRLRGWLSFYQGDDIQAEFRRLDTIGWREDRKPVRLRGEVLDAGTGNPLPARLYVHGADGSWLFARSESNEGSAVEYRKKRDQKSVEMHTTLSAHPFLLDLPPGKYTITVEHGKEYLPESRAVTVGSEPVEEKFHLKRWIDLAKLGWYSGETHCHRSLEELPNVMLAEDLNVAFPLLYWVTEAFAPPRTSGRSTTRPVEAKPIIVDATHAIYPRNTEYEIFTVDKKPHMLGAVFVLNHKSVFEEGVPPVGPVARRAKQEGALLELDKHNWPWSMMLVPVMGVDLYELSNNHIWRTEFAFTGWGEPAADWMQAERGRDGLTEAGWIEYGFRNYYTLLNCGFRLRPTAGTASGVHPVPLGFGRVYVHLDPAVSGFSHDAWVKGLNAGRSFVTTGPMLLAELDGRDPGEVFRPAGDGPHTFHLTGRALSATRLSRIEVIVNGEVSERIKPANHKTEAGGYETNLEAHLKVDGASWLAVRCYEEHSNARVRFAHTAPWHIEVPGKPLRPRKAEVEYLVKRVEEQLHRSAGVLPEAALAEYRQGLRVYQELAKGAR